MRELQAKMKILRLRQGIFILVTLIAAAAWEAQSGELPATSQTGEPEFQGLSSRDGDHPTSHRRLHQTGGCIQWMPETAGGCPSAYPVPSCCTPGPMGPSLCGPMTPACPNKYCC